jgi:hypothetical protein
VRLSPRERWIGFIATAAAALYVWFTLQPDLLLSNTTTNGGDTGAHVWWPAYLRDHILPKWRLTGWTPDWYAGFPAGVFYFPLPSLLIVFLDVFLPYNVAFKLVTVLGPVMLPVAAYSFARGIGARWPGPPLFAVATLPFLFYTGYTIWGGNLASTLAGEFSFTIALALGLFFMGALARALDERKGLALAAALLAATVMSHLIVAVFVAVGAVVIWLQRRPLRNFTPALGVAAVAFCLTAIWSVPLILRLGYTTDMGWTKEKPFGLSAGVSCLWTDAKCENLIPDDLHWAFLLAALGVIVGLFARRKASNGLLVMALVFGLAFVMIPEARLWNARLLPFFYLCVLFLAACGVAEIAVLLTRAAPGVGWALWHAVSTPEPAPSDLPAVDPAVQATFGPPEPVPPPPGRLPVDPLPVHPAVQAVLGPPEPQPLPGDGGGPAPVRNRWQVYGWVVPALVVAVALGSALQYTHKTRSFLPAWIRWNYSGYEAKPAYAEFKDVIETMDTLEPGRALWEPSSGIDKYGTTLALELLPHFTDGKIGSMEGLYFESAATTPYHFMVVSALAKSPSNPVRGLSYRTLADFDLGIAQMRLMGVRYYMAQSDEAKALADARPEQLKLRAETGSPEVAPQVARWKIYEVLDSPLVEPLRNEPVVIDGLSHKHWLAPAAEWFDDAQGLDRPLADGGPEEWARASETEARLQPKKPVKAVTVSNIESGDDTVSFDVSEPGVPVLVKTSYFPNWGVKGAKGPWRASPNLMVVVPTDTHVELHYGRTGVDWAGIFLSVVGLLGLAGLAGWKLDALPPRSPWRRRQQEAGAPPAGPSDGPEPHSEEEPAPLRV